MGDVEENWIIYLNCILPGHKKLKVIYIYRGDLSQLQIDRTPRAGFFTSVYVRIQNKIKLASI